MQTSLILYLYPFILTKPLDVDLQCTICTTKQQIKTEIKEESKLWSPCAAEIQYTSQNKAVLLKTRNRYGCKKGLKANFVG